MKNPVYIICFFALFLVPGMTSCKADHKNNPGKERVSIVSEQDTVPEKTKLQEKPVQTTYQTKDDAGHTITYASPYGAPTIMKFEEETFDFGTIKEGEKFVHEYKFRNEGKEDLKIQDAQGSCGCTWADFPKEPIPPGGSGIIKVTFDSNFKFGPQTKTVTITANTNPPRSFINITGNVTRKE